MSYLLLMRHLRAHQDADLLEPLPLAVEGQQGTDLEVARCDVEGLGNTGPLFEIAKSGPAGNAVIYDE